MTDIPCSQCPLRELPLFVPCAPGDLELIQSLKKRMVSVAAGDSIIQEGQTDAPLFTDWPICTAMPSPARGR